MLLDSPSLLDGSLRGSVGTDFVLVPLPDEAAKARPLTRAYAMVQKPTTSESSAWKYFLPDGWQAIKAYGPILMLQSVDSPDHRVFVLKDTSGYIQLFFVEAAEGSWILWGVSKGGASYWTDKLTQHYPGPLEAPLISTASLDDLVLLVATWDLDVLTIAGTTYAMAPPDLLKAVTKADVDFFTEPATNVALVEACDPEYNQVTTWLPLTTEGGQQVVRQPATDRLDILATDEQVEVQPGTLNADLILAAAYYTGRRIGDGRRVSSYYQLNQVTRVPLAQHPELAEAIEQEKANLRTQLSGATHLWIDNLLLDLLSIDTDQLKVQDRSGNTKYLDLDTLLSLSLVGHQVDPVNSMAPLSVGTLIRYGACRFAVLQLRGDTAVILDWDTLELGEVADHELTKGVPLTTLMCHWDKDSQNLTLFDAGDPSIARSVWLIGSDWNFQRSVTAPGTPLAVDRLNYVLDWTDREVDYIPLTFRDNLIRDMFHLPGREGRSHWALYSQGGHLYLESPCFPNPGEITVTDLKALQARGRLPKFDLPGNQHCETQLNRLNNL